MRKHNSQTMTIISRSQVALLIILLLALIQHSDAFHIFGKFSHHRRSNALTTSSSSTARDIARRPSLSFATRPSTLLRATESENDTADKEAEEKEEEPERPKQAWESQEQEIINKAGQTLVQNILVRYSR